MKCLSLWQPWAGLLACGMKKSETRSWEPPGCLIGQPIAIHAAKVEAPGRNWIHSLPRECKLAIWALMDDWADHPATSAYGAIVGVAVLDAVHRTEDIYHQITPVEALVGNYQPGRFAWAMVGARPLNQPIPYRGRQRLFNIPDDLVPIPGDLTATP